MQTMRAYRAVKADLSNQIWMRKKKMVIKIRNGSENNVLGEKAAE